MVQRSAQGLETAAFTNPSQALSASTFWNEVSQLAGASPRGADVVIDGGEIEIPSVEELFGGDTASQKAVNKIVDKAVKEDRDFDDKYKFKSKQEFQKWLADLQIMKAQDYERSIKALVDQGKISLTDAMFLLSDVGRQAVQQAEAEWAPPPDYEPVDAGVDYGGTAVPVTDTGSGSGNGGGSSGGGSSGGSGGWDGGGSSGGGSSGGSGGWDGGGSSAGGSSGGGSSGGSGGWDGGGSSGGGSSGGSGGWEGGGSAPVMDLRDVLAPEGSVGRVGDPHDFFFTQFAHPKWNPGGLDSSSDCGPASLAMAALAFGKFNPGLEPDQMIVATRQAMGASSDRHTGTGDEQIVTGARNLGLHATNMYGGGLPAINSVLEQGGLAVVTGNPFSYTGELGFRNRGNEMYANDGYYNGGHMVLVTGFENGKYIVNDPAAKVGPIQLSPQQMQNYLNGEGGNGVIGVYP